MLIAEKKLKDPLYRMGLILIAVSFLLYLVPVIYPTSMKTVFAGSFLINFCLAAGYIIALRFSGKLKKGNNGLHHIFLFLLLFLISAYSLNRDITVFEKSVNWFALLLIAVCTNYILFIFFAHIPQLPRYIICFIAGVAMVVFFYLAVYLLPLYPFGGLAFFALGLSLHVFVPLLFCIYTIVLMRRVNTETRRYWLPFGVGVALPVIFVIIYAVTWNRHLGIINKNFRYASITSNNQLPTWVRVAQRIRKNDTTEKILKTDLVYSVPDPGNRDWFWGAFSNFEDNVHDPLVMISALFSGPVNVPVEDRIKILESMYESRNQAEERLWSGKDLVTVHVGTNIELWPSLRLAYTELNLTVSHMPDNTSWTNSQEAIYTFHLPEGGVVTSLSLWIEGKEEKGILTTKSKADSAYKTIVGGERRDPSVVHWQEGNRVSVRVFPVVKAQSRKFKLGTTSPLVFRDKQLHYENIYFDGPSFTSAEEDINISSHEELKITALPEGFLNDKNSLTRQKGKYSPGWTLSFDALPVSSEAFTFGDRSYIIKPVHQQTEHVDFQQIFLDINSSWSPGECERVYNIVKDKKLYVSTGDDSFKELTGANKGLLFDELRTNNFSLFPFYKMADTRNALVITKNGKLSPTVDDLRANSFISQTQQFFADRKSVRLFNLGTTLSPYLKSLKEFRMLEYTEGGEQQLERLLARNTFIKSIESDNEVVLTSAEIAILRTHVTTPGTAPDHIMRLFAYNHILRRSGNSILADTLNEEPLIEEAEQAYVVSPFSSLVVLETQKDYDRFDIAASKNSLQNASSQSKGAVPEPHEWALIILVVVVCVMARYHPRFAYLRNNK